MGSAMASVFRLLADYGPAFVQALLLTWKLTAISFAAGFVLGLVVTVLRLLPLRPLRFVLTGYVEIFRNIPSAVLLIFIVFALPDLNVLIDYEPSVILTLTLVCSAFTADYLRAGINTVSGGQVQAALSLGMRPIRIIYSVVLPQALRAVVQPMTSLLIALMLSTSLASQVPFPGRELTALVARIANDSAAGMPAFAVAAAMYVASGLLIAWAGATLEKKVRILR
jgi:His/Glu/Gln/Arg/opine family amino acid ABC transporter permease subunit